MADHLVRVVTENGAFRGIACETTALCREVCVRHKTSPTASVALSRALTGAVLYSALLKGDQRVAMRYEGNGTIGKIVVEADGGGNVRGYVENTDIDSLINHGTISVPNAIGNAALLTVTKDLGLGHPQSGIVHCISGEIGDDLAYYLTESEQIPSAVGVSAHLNIDGNIDVAGGFLIQLLPPLEDTDIDAVINRVTSLSLQNQLVDGKEPKEILEMLFDKLLLKELGRINVKFLCTCSKERFSTGLITLGKDELKKIAATDGHIESVCHFCNQVYNLSHADIISIIRNA